MSDYVVLLGVIIGGAISIVSALVLDQRRAKREEKRWKEEKRIEKETSTIEYFRNIYNALAPFLAISSQFNHALGGAVTLRTETPKEQEQANQIRALLPKFLDAYDDFLAKGYAGLLPKDFGNKILKYGEKIAFLDAELKNKPKVKDWNGEIFKLISEISVIGEQVRSRIRQLLNVESLDLACMIRAFLRHLGITS